MARIIIGAALVALLAGCAAAQSVVSRAEAELTSCTRCGALGDPELFDTPLYSDCDATLLESLFDGAVYEIESQASVQFSNLNPADFPTPPLSADDITPPVGNAFEIEAVGFQLRFLEAFTFGTTSVGSAPTFIAEFTGTADEDSGVTVEFELPVLCTLNPSASSSYAEADCTGDLTALENAGVIPKLPRSFSPPAFFNSPLNNFTLIFRRTSRCESRELIFVGTDVERASTAFPNAVNEVEPAPTSVPELYDDGRVVIPDFVLQPPSLFSVQQAPLFVGVRTRV